MGKVFDLTTIYGLVDFLAWLKDAGYWDTCTLLYPNNKQLEFCVTTGKP